MHSSGNPLFWVLLIGFMVALMACGPTTRPDESILLSQDYYQMTDAELIGYEQELSDELNRAASGPDSDLSIGFGFGTWGSRSGYGVSTSQRVGTTDSESKIELRNRRDQVRTEMRRRGLIK